MTDMEVLTAARTLVAKGWTRAAEARTADGSWCDAFASNATQFCVFGALQRVCGRVDNRLCAYLRQFLPNEFLWLSDYNDAPTTTQADVLALFDRAIQEAQHDQTAA